MVPNIQTGSGLMGHPPLDKVSNRLTGHRQLDKDCSKDNNIEMEFVTELTFCKATHLQHTAAASEMSLSSEALKSRKFRRIQSFSSRHKTCGNLLKEVKEGQECNKRESMRKHDKEVERIQDTLNMLGRVSSYIKTKVLTNMSAARYLPRPSYRPPDIEAPDQDGGTEESIEEMLISRTLPIIEHKQAPLCIRNNKKTSLSLPPCSYSLDRDVCNSFPCVMPREYTTLGYQLTPSSGGGVHTDNRIRRGNPQGDHTADIWSSPHCEDWSKMNSLRRPIRSHADDKIAMRESSLNCAFDLTRRKHEKLRVADWAVMYGEKIPIAKMKKLEALRRKDSTGEGRRASTLVQNMRVRPFKY